jgi:L-ascorbate metabolism protein UlaG (beta-lactamase superfamily)
VEWKLGDLVQLTKHGHSCVRIEIGERAVVIDPGVFSDADTALAGIDSVLITHEHPDHLDPAALERAAAKNPNLRIYAPNGVTTQLAKIESLAGHVETIAPAQSFVASGIQIRTYGGQHALIHSSVPVIDNVGYLVADNIYHPGDSYFVPNAEVTNLLVPISAPWAKLSETFDFVTSVRAEHVFQIHDGLLTDAGKTIYESHLKRIDDFYHRSPYTRLENGTTVDL